MKILVGYTGSKAGKAALDLAGAHAKAFGAQIDVVFSLNRKSEKDSKKIHEAEQVLEYAGNFYKKAGIPCKTALLIRGLSHGEDLIQYADENNIDEIVIGASRSSLVGKLVFGNTAQYVILNADCPVILTKSRLYNNIEVSRYIATEKTD
ncbi:MAG: universal stress protein [Deltaproteobacteria bacterium]|nr:universal stress protein [Deltaproteobacteria bacterium]